MSIQTETVEMDGGSFVRTWSDGGMRIERDGKTYDEAYDPEGSGREYTETDEPVETDEPEESADADETEEVDE